MAITSVFSTKPFASRVPKLRATSTSTSTSTATGEELERPAKELKRLVRAINA